MDELNQGLAIAMHGEAADRQRDRFLQQAREWQVALPGVPPLVLDFGLGRFDEIGLIEYWIANEAKAGYCGKYLFVFDQQACPEHCHRRKHETFFVVKGAVTIRCKGQDHHLEAGGSLAVAPGSKHGFIGHGPALLLELSMPCEIEDNYFTDTNIPIGGNHR